MTYFDQEKETRYHPYVIEPARGVDRALLAFLIDAYTVDEAPSAKGAIEKRTVLRLHTELAPVKVAVLPLSRNDRLVPEAKRVHELVRERWMSAVRRRGRDRPSVPSPGRDRHAVLRDGRLRLARGRGRHRARARLDGAGADRRSPTLVDYLRERL